MTDCKNCKYTDEYCASGDCNKIQANNIACNEISLTEQWKKGELPEGWYYVKCDDEIFVDYYEEEIVDLETNETEKSWRNYFGIDEVLAQVPSYDEWKAAQEQLHKEGVWYTEISHKKVLKENAQLKELLKDCFEYIDWTDGTGSPISQQELLNKIDEALR